MRNSNKNNGKFRFSEGSKPIGGILTHLPNKIEIQKNLYIN